MKNFLLVGQILIFCVAAHAEDNKQPLPLHVAKEKVGKDELILTKEEIKKDLQKINELYTRSGQLKVKLGELQEKLLHGAKATINLEINNMTLEEAQKEFIGSESTLKDIQSNLSDNVENLRKKIAISNGRKEPLRSDLYEALMLLKLSEEVAILKIDSKNRSADYHKTSIENNEATVADMEARLLSAGK